MARKNKKLAEAFESGQEAGLKQQPRSCPILDDPTGQGKDLQTLRRLVREWFKGYDSAVNSSRI